MLIHPKRRVFAMYSFNVHHENFQSIFIGFFARLQYISIAGINNGWYSIKSIIIVDEGISVERMTVNMKIEKQHGKNCNNINNRWITNEYCFNWKSEWRTKSAGNFIYQLYRARHQIAETVGFREILNSHEKGKMLDGKRT